MMSPEKLASNEDVGQYDDEEMNVTSSASLLHEDQKKQELPFCGFISLQYYQPYFDVDTSDITTRLLNAAISFRVCKRWELLVVFVD